MKNNGQILIYRVTARVRVRGLVVRVRELGLESVYEEWLWLQLSILGEITALTSFCTSTGVSVIGPGKECQWYWIMFPSVWSEMMTGM